MTLLRDTLTYDPVELKFGTSGRRGLVVDLTQLEIYISVRGELDFLQELPPEEGGVEVGDVICVGNDLRPSSVGFVAKPGGRGELVQAVVAAIEDAGFRAMYLGAIPTPALSAFALNRRHASIMVTGSHIPFDRNGYKLNTAVGELLKTHEPTIAKYTAQRRHEFYQQSAELSPFDSHGMFREGHRSLPDPASDATTAYIGRYAAVFPQDLQGTRILFYEHSSVGRELVPAMLEALGAEVVRCGRSDIFVPIDTEDLGADQLTLIQGLLEEAAANFSHFDAIVSCDGDADRPLVLAIEEGKVEFIPGDLLGMLTAEYLQPDAIVVPISCNPAIDDSPLQAVLEPKTRIGSPYVIAGMDRAIANGAQRVCGWEANGGFLLGTDFDIHGVMLAKLPTRDAALPIISSLLLAKQTGLKLHELVARLPQRFGATALLRNFPRATGQRLVAQLSPQSSDQTLEAITHLRRVFAGTLLEDIASADYTDGVRMYASSGEVLHLRPSGNADEFRVYAVARSKARAAELATNAERFIKEHYAG